MALTKTKIAGKINLTKDKSIDCVEILLKIVKNALASGEYVLISGFGKFCVNG